MIQFPARPKSLRLISRGKPERIVPRPVPSKTPRSAA